MRAFTDVDVAHVAMATKKHMYSSAGHNVQTNQSHACARVNPYHDRPIIRQTISYINK